MKFNKFYIFIILLFIIFFILCKNTKIEITEYLYCQNGKLCFKFDSKYSNETYDKLHGFHELASELFKPKILAKLLKNVKNYLEDNEHKFDRYIEILESSGSNNSANNIVALYSAAYWEMVYQIYQKNSNYIKKESCREIQLSIEDLKLVVFLEINELDLFIPSITMMINLSESVDREILAFLGSKNKIIQYLEQGIIKGTANYVWKTKYVCSNFPLKNSPMNIDIAFNDFKHTGIKFDNFQKHFRQYQIAPKIRKDSNNMPLLQFSLRSTSERTNIVYIPLPLTIKEETQRSIYIENSVHALFGKLLKSGISREFTLMIKLGNLSHEHFFKAMIDQLRVHFNKEIEGKHSQVNIEPPITDEYAIFYQVSLIPDHSDCKSIDEINQIIDTANDLIENYIENDKELRTSYKISKKWEQVILIESD